MLLYRVMQATKFFATAVFQWLSLDDHVDVGWVDQPWTVIAGLETFDGFSIVLTRTRKSLYDSLGRAVLEGVLKVHQLLRVQQFGTIMNRN